MKKAFYLRSRMVALALGTIAVVSFNSCSKDDDPVTPTQKNIVEIAQSDTTFSILVSAVTKAGLVSTLSTTPNLTVFAPTNAAFRNAGYPQSAIDALNPTQITDILTPILKYHVVGAKVLAANVPTSDTVKTLNGLNLFASKNAAGVFLNGIKVTTADLVASNGVVHVIGSVLVPPTQTIAEVVISNPNFSLLKAAVIRGNLATTLGGAGKFTVFAPVNSGFPATLDTDGEINAAPVADVAGIVTAHAFGTNIFASDLVAGTTGNTLNAAKTLTVGLSPVSVKITGSTNTASLVTTANVVCKNGVIHIIDKVLQ